jgi:hypothetical protein
LSPFAPKLTADELRAIRQAVAEGSATKAELAARYGVSRQAIHNIVIGRTWKQVDGPRTRHEGPRSSTGY